MIQVKQDPISEVLTAKFEQALSKNPSYSLRAFSKKLGMNSGALSLIMNKKRRISKDYAAVIAEKLNLTDSEKKDFFKPFRAEMLLKSNSIHRYETFKYRVFQPDELWIALAILNFVKCKSFNFSAENISRSLCTPLLKTRAVLDKIVLQKLILWDDNGVPYRTKERIQTSDGISSEFLKCCHSINLDLAKKTLHSLDVSERDFSSVTFAMEEDFLPEATSLIREFQDKLQALGECGSPNKVYKMNVQLFPLNGEGYD